MPDFQTIEYKRKGHIAYVRLNRPEVLNALNATMNLELMEAWEEFDNDDEAWVAILSGNGRAFCSGNDNRDTRVTPEVRRRLQTSQAKHARGIGFYGESRNYKPIIAAVHGYCQASGYLMASACDLVIAAEGTRLHIQEARRGSNAATYWVSAWFYSGSRFANEIVVTGRPFWAEEALKHGLLNYVVPQEQLIEKAEELANAICQNPPLSVRATVRTLRWYETEAVKESSLYVSGLQLDKTEDYREGGAALMQRREPVFKGR